tara:strand:- start:1915 stop:3345 length:1431 start_codon:yes stop_codon:yes gene_type:complete
MTKLILLISCQIIFLSFAKPKVYNVKIHGGMEEGEFYLDIKVGTPSLPFRVQVDTGSSLLFVPSKECSTCSVHTKRVYDIEGSVTAERIGCDSIFCDRNTCSSSSFCSKACSAQRNSCCSVSDPEECGFGVKYGGGTSASGPLTRDIIQIGNLKHKVTFGRVTEEKGMWLSSVDGILGLAFRGLDCSPSCVPPLIGELVDANLVNDIFALCFGDKGGLMTIGGIDSNLYNGEIFYTPIMANLDKTYTFYTISLSDIKIGDTTIFQDIQLDDTAVIDSGSTLILLRRPIYNQIMKRFRRDYCHLEAVCMKPSIIDAPIEGTQHCLDNPPYGEWPTFEFHLGDVRLYISPDLYFVRSHNKFCFAIRPTPPAVGKFNLLGDALLRGFYTVFDRANKTVGFATANSRQCGLPKGGNVNSPLRNGFLHSQKIVIVTVCCVSFPLLILLLSYYHDPVGGDRLDLVHMLISVDEVQENIALVK